MPKITIKCNSETFCNFKDLVDFQGDLKIRTEQDVEKIKSSLKKHGFSFPFYIWESEGKKYVLDGHGRLEALKSLESEGYEIPELPAVYVNCKSKSDAKDLLLRLNSQYGKMNKGSVLSFIDNDFSVLSEDFALPLGEIAFIDEFKKIDFLGSTEPPKVSPTTSAPNPVVNEMPLDEGADNTQFNFATQETGEQPTSYHYEEPIMVEKPKPTSYLFRLKDLKFETTVAEYQKFKNFMQQYADFYKTTTGAINELFKRIS